MMESSEVVRFAAEIEATISKAPKEQVVSWVVQLEFGWRMSGYGREEIFEVLESEELGSALKPETKVVVAKACELLRRLAAEQPVDSHWDH